MSDLKVVGMVDRIGNVEIISDKFRKRTLVIVQGMDTQYPQHIKFEFTQNNADKLDYVNPGDNVEVSFNLRGREYTNKRTGEQDVFNSLQGWYVKKADNATAPAKVEAPIADGDLPF